MAALSAARRQIRARADPNAAIGRRRKFVKQLLGATKPCTQARTTEPSPSSCPPSICYHSLHMVLHYETRPSRSSDKDGLQPGSQSACGPSAAYTLSSALQPHSRKLGRKQATPIKSRQTPGDLQYWLAVGHQFASHRPFYSHPHHRHPKHHIAAWKSCSPLAGNTRKIHRQLSQSPQIGESKSQSLYVR